ncbi:PREDICTED: proline-rich protein 12-like, partial [Cyprinodon variegatus]|uniref:proline-rich protein 12-like n=1 Tax=Cyprinodon variegatus TaxID=28743 RepID=UPI0007425471
MCYQRLYVKFLENVNKKDYVRVCSRKPWHRTALALRRQSLAKQLLSSHSQPRAEREDRDKERQKERDLKEQRARERREEREKQEREHKEKMIRERERRESSEKERENEQRERREAEEKDRQREQEKREQEWRERQRREREQQEFERKERRMEILQQERKREKKQREQKEREQREAEREKRRGQDGSLGSPKEERTSKDRAEPPPKKRKTWLKEVPSSSSESDSSRHSDDEGQQFRVVVHVRHANQDGPVQEGVNSRAMREMFRSYVEMLVSTALDPDMIQALEDTDDELYLPPMRKIDSLLNDQKKLLLRRISMSAQHQEALHTYPNMTADPLESGAVWVHLGGEGYSRKTLSRVKKSVAKQQ